MNRRLLPICILAILWLPRLAAGQGQSYCQFQGVTVTRVANGLRISLKADGMIEAESERQLRWSWSERIPFNLSNMRGGADAIINIGQYPLSHIEFTPLPDGKDGIGLRCTLVFTRSAWFCAFDSQPDDFDDSWYGWDGVPRVMIKRTQQGNELLIMIISDKPVIPESPSIENTRVQLEIGGSAERLNLHALNAGLRDVIARISALTGRTIYLSSDVSRKVTMHLEDMPVDRLLEVLARGYALSLAARDGAYYLSPGVGGGASGYWASTLRTIPLNYLTPGNARALLPDTLLPYIKPNNDARAVTVSGAPALMDKITQDLRALDQPSYHCVLRAWVISDETTNEGLYDMMIRATSSNTSGSVEGSGNIVIQHIDGMPEQVLAKITSIVKSKTMTIKSMPTVQVANGQYANLFIGNTIYYWRLPDVRLDAIDAGTRLRVTPLTSGEWITVDYRAEDRFLRERNNLGPLVLKRTLNGTIRIRSGDTLLVGGLQMDTSELRRGKLLSPGWPFTVSKSSRRVRQQVWVLLKADAVLNPIGMETNAPDAKGIL
jgi:hypothetical protein